MSTTREPEHQLPSQFRKWDISRRREALMAILAARGVPRQTAALGIGSDAQMVELADILIESAVGYAALPFGICRGVIVDGRTFDVPMVTEEPSVIAGAAYASRIIGRAGGFRTGADDPVSSGFIYIEDATPDAVAAVRKAEPEIRTTIAPFLRRMEERGGGYRGLTVSRLEQSGIVRAEIRVDVRDAMGANIVNTVAEAATPVVERVSGGRGLMSILTNIAEHRMTRATFRVSLGVLARGGYSGREAARRLVAAGTLAGEDAARAVTHNKGVMNGVSALMLATGNDARAVEAAVHYHAGRTGTYRGVTRYRIIGGELEGSIEIPLPVGTVGGSTSVHPTSRTALGLLGNPSSTQLARIAASLGLAQNFAAIFALVTEGIQHGHMALHNRRVGRMSAPEDGSS